MSDIWHKPQMINIRPRKPRMLFIGDCTRTPAVWYIEPLRQYFDVFHVGMGSQDFDITNIPTYYKVNQNEMGHTEVKERTFSLDALFNLIGRNFDIIFHIQDYTQISDLNRSPIPYIFLCNEAAYPLTPRCAWVVLASVELIKRQVKRDWIQCPNIMYSPYALPVETPLKFPDGKREYDTSFAGELYSLQLYEERAMVVKYIHEQCLTQNIPSDFNYLFPAGVSTFTVFEHDSIQKGYTINIIPEVKLFIPEEAGAILLSVDKKILGVMDKILLFLIQQHLQQINYKTKNTEQKKKDLLQKYTEIEKHLKSYTRYPEAGKGLIGNVRYATVLQSTKVALNVPTPAGFNFRDIEICLAGAMLLTKHTTDHDLLGFEDGINCRYYSTKEEALEIIKHGYDPEIAAKGWDLVTHGRSFWKHQRGHIGNVIISTVNDIITVQMRKYLPEFKELDILNGLKGADAIIDFKSENNRISFNISNPKTLDMCLQAFGLQQWTVDGLTIGHRIYNLFTIFEKFANIPKPPNAGDVIPK